MLRPLLRSLLLGATLAGAFHVQAQAQAQAQVQAQERRHALVVGNAEYRTLGRLATPTADARLVADTLRRSGFEVTEQGNVDDRSMRRVLRDFTQRVDAAGPGGVAVVYLAGYALYSETANFFLPVNAQLRRPEDIGVQGMSVDDVLAAVSATSAQLRVVLVDAARAPASLDRQQFGTGGFGAVLVPEQTIVGLAAQPGAVAPEGERNSPFAAALSRYLGAPGLHIEESLRQVRCEVYETTRGQQIPWESSTFIGTFVAVPGQARGPDVCAPAPVQAGRSTVGSTRAFAALPAAIPIPRDRPRGTVRVTREKLVQLPPEQAYEEVIEDGSIGAYETFVQVYPNDPRTVYFRDRVRARQESDVWLEVVEENSPQAYERYLRRFPYGSYRTQAVVRIERFGGRVPDLPPPPREYYEEVLRPRATIVGPGIMAPPRQVFVPGGPTYANPGQSAPAAAQPAPAPLVTSPAPAPGFQGGGRPGPATPGTSAPSPDVTSPAAPPAAAPGTRATGPQPAPTAAPPATEQGGGRPGPATPAPATRAPASQPAPTAAPSAIEQGGGRPGPATPAPSTSPAAPPAPAPATRAPGGQPAPSAAPSATEQGGGRPAPATSPSTSPAAPLAPAPATRAPGGQPAPTAAPSATEQGGGRPGPATSSPSTSPAAPPAPAPAMRAPTAQPAPTAPPAAAPRPAPAPAAPAPATVPAAPSAPPAAERAPATAPRAVQPAPAPPAQPATPSAAPRPTPPPAPAQPVAPVPPAERTAPAARPAPAQPSGGAAAPTTAPAPAARPPAQAPTERAPAGGEPRASAPVPSAAERGGGTGGSASSGSAAGPPAAGGAAGMAVERAARPRRPDASGGSPDPDQLPAGRSGGSARP